MQGMERKKDKDCKVTLPDEIKCIIDKHLPLASKASLASTCSTFYFFYNKDHFKPPNTQVVNRDHSASDVPPTLFYNRKPETYYNPYIRLYRIC